MADQGGAAYGLKFFQFHAVFIWKNWQNCMLAPPGGSAPPLTGNPGFASAVVATANKTAQSCARFRNLLFYFRHLLYIVDRVAHGKYLKYINGKLQFYRQKVFKVTKRFLTSDVA